jgi:hypothetical protein
MEPASTRYWVRSGIGILDPKGQVIQAYLLPADLTSYAPTNFSS